MSQEDIRPYLAEKPGLLIEQEEGAGMVYPMPSFIESSMKTQNSIMILMEICLILELIVLFPE